MVPTSLYSFCPWSPLISSFGAVPASYNSIPRCSRSASISLGCPFSWTKHPKTKMQSTSDSAAASSASRIWSALLPFTYALIPSNTPLPKNDRQSSVHKAIFIRGLFFFIRSSLTWKQFCPFLQRKRRVRQQRRQRRTGKNRGEILFHKCFLLSYCFV